MLSSILLLPSFGNIIIYASFKINQNEIAKTICIQRKVKNNDCNGGCELRKSLKKFEDNEKRETTILKEKSDLVYLQNDSENKTPYLINSKNQLSSFSLITKKTISINNTSFRPPIYFI